MKGGLTPKQAATDIALGWLKAAYTEQTADIHSYITTPYEHKLVKDQIAKLHNRLLDKSGLDGQSLEEIL